MFVTALSVTSASNIDVKNVFTFKSSPTNLDIVWEENWDSYSNGQDVHGVGGWKGWDNDSDYSAKVTNNQSRSSPNSIDIRGNADLVREYDGLSSGTWTFTDYIYVPSDFEGLSYFILLSKYEDGGGQEGNEWALQVRFDSTTQEVVAEHDGEILPLITDEWVEMRVEIDLEADWFECYYGGDLLQEKEWTATPNNDFQGILNIGAIDLFANGATTVYHDDLTIDGEVASEPDLSCEGSISWVNATPKETKTDTITIKNVGGPATLLNWEVTDWPSWGEWTFDPSSGTDLTPEDGDLIIDVSCVIPKDKNEEFIGKIKIENLEDSEDFCYIDVLLTTPKVKAYTIYSAFLIFLENHPNLFPILRYKLGL
jgi:hypothetical protein